MPVIPRPRRAAALLSFAMTFLVACSAATPTGSPSTAPASASDAAPPAPVASASSAPVAQSAAPATPSPTLAPTPSPIPAVWQKVGPDAGHPMTFLATVIATPAGFIAAGSTSDGSHPAAISSADGISWHSETIAGATRTPAALVVWGDRLIASGPGETACAHPFGLDTWVRSRTGRWTEAPFTDILCEAEDVHAVIVHNTPILVGSGPGDVPVVWSSADGIHWVDHRSAAAGLFPTAVVSNGATATMFLQDSTGVFSSTTTNGTAWSAPKVIPGLPGDLLIFGAFRIAGRTTLVASDGGVLGTITSNSGGGWTRHSATGLSADQLGTVTAFHGGLLASGGNGPGAAAWVSSDGTSWRKLALPADLSVEGARVSGIAVLNGRAVLVGGWPSGADNLIGGIWTGAASLVAP